MRARRAISLAFAAAAFASHAVPPFHSGPSLAAGAPVKWIDTHVHVPGRQGNRKDVPGAVQAAAAVMDGSHILRMVLMPVPQVAGKHPPQTLEEFLSEARKYTNRFVVMGGGGSLNPMIHNAAAGAKPDDALRRKFTLRAEEILSRGAIGFGEVSVLHLASYPGQQFEDVPADHPLLLALADIAARHDVVIDIHFDAVLQDMDSPVWLPRPQNPPKLRRNIEGFKRFLKHNPEAKIVWAHLGSDFIGNRTVELTRSMLKEHPNLYMSLRLGPGRVPSNHPMTETGIKPDWLQLFKEFPDRFVIGTDQIFSLPGGQLTAQHEKQRGIVRERTNRFLSWLPPDLAKAIAYENAVRLYKIRL